MDYLGKGDATATAVMPEADEIYNACEPSAYNNDLDGLTEADEASDAGAIVKNKPLPKRQVQMKCIYHNHRRTVVEELNTYLKKLSLLPEKPMKPITTL